MDKSNDAFLILTLKSLDFFFLIVFWIDDIQMKQNKILFLFFSFTEYSKYSCFLFLIKESAWSLYLDDWLLNES